jgi:hypothetical protein
MMIQQGRKEREQQQQQQQGEEQMGPTTPQPGCFFCLLGFLQQPSHSQPASQPASRFFLPPPTSFLVQQQKQHQHILHVLKLATVESTRPTIPNLDFLGAKQDILNPFTSTIIIDFLGTNKHILNQFTSITSIDFLGTK